MTRNSLVSQLDQQLPQQARERAREVDLGTTAVSKEDPLYTSVGASVAVCLIDRKTAWCGLRQVMMPSFSPGQDRRDALLRADASLEDLFNQLCAVVKLNPADVGKGYFQAKLFGGSHSNAKGLHYSNGGTSVTFARTWLKNRHIAIVAESLGGLHRREIVLLPKKGVVYCRMLILEEDFISEEMARLSGESQDANKIELF